jgi:hypothetical protein
MAWFFERGGYLELSGTRGSSGSSRRSGSGRSVVRAGQLWLERVRDGTGDRPQPEGLGIGADHRGRVWTGSQKSTKVGVLFRPSYHLTFDTAIQRNDIHLPFPMHDFVTNLVTSRIGYAFNTRTFLDTLVQYNTDLKQFSANVRFDLIHRPLSDLFVVYNEQRLTDEPTPINTGAG